MRLKTSKTAKGRIPWCKGKTKYTDSRLAKAGIKISDRWANLSIEERIKIGNKFSLIHSGRRPWNKGITSKDDSRIPAGAKNGMHGRTHTDEVKLKLSEKASKQFSGEGNPWFGKSRSKELSPRWDASIDRNSYRSYLLEAYSRTEQVYRKNIETINPLRYPRTLAGIDGGYHLDHIIPLKYAYLNKISLDIVCHPKNLRMIPWEENLNRRTKDESEVIKNKIVELSQLV